MPEVLPAGSALRANILAICEATLKPLAEGAKTAATTAASAKSSLSIAETGAG